MRAVGVMSLAVTLFGLSFIAATLTSGGGTRPVARAAAASGAQIAALAPNDPLPGLARVAQAPKAKPKPAAPKRQKKRAPRVVPRRTPVTVVTPQPENVLRATPTPTATAKPTPFATPVPRPVSTPVPRPVRTPAPTPKPKPTPAPTFDDHGNPDPGGFDDGGGP